MVRARRERAIVFEPLRIAFPIFEPTFPFPEYFRGSWGRGNFRQLEDEVMSNKTTALRKIEASRYDATKNVKFRAANVDDAVGANDWVIRFGSVVAEFFNTGNERVTKVAAAGDGAVAGLAWGEAARDAGVNQLPRHGGKLRIGDWGLRIVELVPVFA